MIRATNAAIKFDLTGNRLCRYVNPFWPKEFYQSEDKSREKYEPEGGLGLKCLDFQLRCVLQSVGDFTQKDELEFERERAGSSAKIRALPSCYDEATGYPIYMMFEVIHVYRRLNRRQEEAIERRAALPVKEKVAGNKVYQLLALHLCSQVDVTIGKQLNGPLIPKGTRADLRKVKFEVKKARTKSLLHVLGVCPAAARPLFDEMQREHLQAEAEANADDQAEKEKLSAKRLLSIDQTPTPSVSDMTPTKKSQRS